VVRARLHELLVLVGGLVVKAKASHHHVEVGKPCAQTLAQVPRVAQPARRHRPDADDRRAALFHELGHLRRQHRRPLDLDLPAGRVDEPAREREGHAVDLVAGRAQEQEAPWCEAALRRFRVPGRRVRAVLVQLLDDVSRRVGHELGVRLADLSRSQSCLA
jgi:hypothetical protein